MNRLRNRVRFALVLLIASFGMILFQSRSHGQPGFRGFGGGPGPGFSGMPHPGPGFSGNFSGNGISGGFSGNGISGGFSGNRGFSGGPVIETVWYCLRCGGEVSRGNTRPTGACPHCNNTGIPRNMGINGGGWNQPPQLNSPPMNSPPINIQPQNPAPIQPQEPNPMIEPGIGGFFTSNPNEAPGAIGDQRNPLANSPPNNPVPEAPKRNTEEDFSNARSNASSVVPIVLIMLFVLGIGAGVLIIISNSNRRARQASVNARRRRPPSYPSRRRYSDD